MMSHAFRNISREGEGAILPFTIPVLKEGKKKEKAISPWSQNGQTIHTTIFLYMLKSNTGLQVHFFSKGWWLFPTLFAAQVRHPPFYGKKYDSTLALSGNIAARIVTSKPVILHYH